MEMSKELPEIVDTENPVMLKQYIVELKEYCQELARRATGQVGGAVKTVAPSVSDVKEGELTPYDDGVNRRMYTKLNGSLRYISLT